MSSITSSMSRENISADKSEIPVSNSEYFYSKKGMDLIAIYENMAKNGYTTSSGQSVAKENTYNTFELQKQKSEVKRMFQKFGIKSVLDYGSGASDWRKPDLKFDALSAFEYFDLEDIFCFEPARDVDQRRRVDCVVSFDVLEHIFVSDVATVLTDIFSYASKLVILNVACYKADATLPNGENAHVTVRHPFWWKGMIDSVSVKFPDVQICLYTSLGYGKTHGFPIFSDKMRENDKKFVVDY